MKTVTIKQEIVDGLNTDERKLDFVNALISMFIEPEPATSSLTAKSLHEGLNVDLPALRIGASFDSRNMGTAEVRRYHMTQGGYVPVCLDCGYDDYEYRYLDDMSDNEVRSFLADVDRNISHSKGKRDHLKFLRYLHKACSIYCIEENRENCLDNF